VVSTTRNRALPLIMRSYASGARSGGNTSVIARTPVRTLKGSVSCESMDVPEYQPATDRRPASSGPAGIARLMGSAEDEQRSIHAQTPQCCAHRFRVGNCCEDDPGATQLE